MFLHHHISWLASTFLASMSLLGGYGVVPSPELSKVKNPASAPGLIPVQAPVSGSPAAGGENPAKTLPTAAAPVPPIPDFFNLPKPGRPASPEVRAFTDLRGVVIRATLVGFSGEDVTLRREDGLVFTAKAGQFSLADLDYFKLHGLLASVPVPPAEALLDWPRTLTSFTWNCNRLRSEDKPWTEFRFSPEGTLSVVTGAVPAAGGRWKLNGPHTIRVDLVPDRTVLYLNFNAGHTAYEALDAQGALRYRGGRKAAISAAPAVAAEKLVLPSLAGRVSPASRAAMLKQYGGSEKSEQAVVRGLQWLRKVQNADGSWGEKNKGAMTGFALLCFLGHGEDKDSPDFGPTVTQAVRWIVENGAKYQGRLSMEEAFSSTGVYDQGICTLALADYYSFTKDAEVVPVLTQAVDHIVRGQGPAGGWMYGYDKSANDLSVSSWQIQALKSAFLTGLNLPGVERSLDRAMEALIKVWKGSAGYGYRGPENKYSLTGAGIFCRLLWKGFRSDVQRSVDWVLEEAEKDNRNEAFRYKSERGDLYAWYYHTQATYSMGGSAWQRWNRWIRDELNNAQNPDGSWPPPGAKMLGLGSGEGINDQVYRTALCLLMLETYYRNLPPAANGPTVR